MVRRWRLPPAPSLSVRHTPAPDRCLQQCVFFPPGAIARPLHTAEKKKIFMALWVPIVLAAKKEKRSVTDAKCVHRYHAPARMHAEKNDPCNRTGDHTPWRRNTPCYLAQVPEYTQERERKVNITFFPQLYYRPHTKPNHPPFFFLCLNIAATSFI
ncbi:hypothetical protein B0J12DRAFT_125098 [Macrophomina phaseolina]|uniref:Secreted protein n=1 Tax=Macrophomina phaseolina TaxID=35725 RepID=A0ABQ8G7Z1_9PEZI|nr:hypothetical protein B0J12DRAFT_125098 [Macrophomina phaseolina]